jgi:hypothetical protein
MRFLGRRQGQRVQNILHSQCYGTAKDSVTVRHNKPKVIRQKGSINTELSNTVRVCKNKRLFEE